MGLAESNEAILIVLCLLALLVVARGRR